MEVTCKIPVIDLFAGAGGLSEGFAAFRHNSLQPYRVSLSVEKDTAACKTLRLRSFYRQFSPGKVPEDYYHFLRCKAGVKSLYDAFPIEAATARNEVLQGELGREKTTAAKLDRSIEDALKDSEFWVLVGGPPCQAYSIAGRGRNRAKEDYVPETDDRHFLYQEYLRVICRHWPSVFVMENVPGILSANVGGAAIFEQILEDLSDPAGLSKGFAAPEGRSFRYRLYSLVRPTEHDMFGVPVNPTSHFIIESHRFGIPQARHRVIVMGVRDDISLTPATLSECGRQIDASEVLTGLPRLRSGLARAEDSDGNWMDALHSITDTAWFESAGTSSLRHIAEDIDRTLGSLHPPEQGRGNAFVPCRPAVAYRPDWYLDDRLGGVCNSETRSHFKPDLHRYLFAASFANIFRRSPNLAEYPDELMPEHRSVGHALTKGHFGDRFRVQIPDEPSTTITSHIARDGHYYIHYDSSQCRSLTVREAARLQTFPDNFFFFGNRGEQYTQVGNALPPMLAAQIAGIVHDLFMNAGADSHDRYAVT